MTGQRTTRWMLNAAAERVADGKEMTEGAFERLYKMFLDSQRRRARRRSRGSAQDADIRNSKRNARAQIAEQSRHAGVADERARFDENPSRAEAEERAKWILTRCGPEFAMSLVAMRDKGVLDDALRVLKTKLVPRR